MVVGGRELIDTLWNVNDLDCSAKIASVIGINRYIMECKSWTYLRGDIVIDELIDTLWNVNIFGT